MALPPPPQPVSTRQAARASAATPRSFGGVQKLCKGLPSTNFVFKKHLIEGLSNNPDGIASPSHNAWLREQLKNLAMASFSDPRKRRATGRVSNSEVVVAKWINSFICIHLPDKGK
jgi:hypothetical protein